MKKTIKLVPRKPGTITDKDRLKTLSDILIKYHADTPDIHGNLSEGAAILFYDKYGDDFSPNGYFGFTTQEWYITADSLQELIDRVIEEIGAT